MERYELLNKLAQPMDKLLEGVMDAARAVGMYEPVREGLYNMIKNNMLSGFKKNNDLEVIGLENVPADGGAVVAANHQSWLDAQVWGSSSERKLHFIAKSEFVDWPILSKFIELTESVFIRRGGDNDGLTDIADKLREGWLVAIFPEGTIPGEEEISRAELDPETGLLRGRSGVVRLAIMSGVPVIPVGISGTGQAYPPEAYPRIEMPPVQKKLPITVRYGKPIYFKEKSMDHVSKEKLREYTHQVMKAISDLVDHNRCFVPIQVPIKKPDTKGHSYYPKKEGKSKWGALVVHGFSSHVSCVDGIAPLLKSRGIAYRIPILRGHGTVPHDMVGTSFQDWYDDAEAALEELSKHAENIIVAGHSMGGLVSLELGIRRPDLVDNVIVLAPALKFADPMSALSPLLSKVFKYWDSPNSYNDESLKAERNRNYPFFATESFTSLFEAAKDIEKRLKDFDRPVLILQAKKDTVVAPKAARIIASKIKSKEKKVIWFDETNHEMLLDLEAEKVLETIDEYIGEVTGLAKVAAPAEKPAAPKKKAAAKKAAPKKAAPKKKAAPGKKAAPKA